MKKELLFITSQLPYPPFKGGVSTSWNLINYLSQHFRTSMVTLLKWEDPDFEQEFLSKVKLEDYFSFELNIERTPAAVIKSYVKGVPINLVRNYHPVVAEKIHSMVDEFDYVFVDHYEMFQYIPEKIKAKTIMHEHNAEFVMWKRYSEVSTNPLKKLITALESRRIQKYEKQYCSRASMVLANPNDQVILNDLTNNVGRIEQIVPCGEDFMLDWADLQWDNTEESLLYIGSLTWEANADGLIWFLNEGWEKLKAKRPNVKFYIVGGNPDPRIKDLAAKHKDIILTGFVDDLEDYYAKCRVFITPLRFGSGVKLKVMNAMFRGIPVVTTPIGSEGMAVENGVHLYHTHNMDEFVGDCADLLVNRPLWEKFRDKSRELTRSQFSWAVQLNNIKQNILSLNGAVHQG
ncbi:MAG: glycosyltransferase [Bacteroidia bacterium]|nr:glycosyltransferase [Bacteroidia bacterium]